MKKKSLTIILTLIMVLSLSGMAFAQPAEDPQGAKQSLVALGDSITSGYGLENNLLRVSRKAYPQLLGDELGYRVTNLAVSGWTSQDLLDVLGSNNRYRVAIKHADMIILNIGGNDVLGYLMDVDFEDPDLNLNEILEGLETNLINYYINLGFILQEIRELNPEAPILNYGFYNPLYEGHPVNFALGEEDFDVLYDLLNFIIGIVNNAVLNDTLLYDDYGDIIPNPVSGIESYADYFDYIYYVDAFAAFEAYALYSGNNKADLFVDEVHPSELGQEILYLAALEVLLGNSLAVAGF